MTKAEWATFNKNFESGVRRKHGVLQSLACSKCHTLQESGCFSDDQVLRAFGMGRKCLTCLIKRGGRDFGNFDVGGVESFGCVGCIQARPLDDEVHIQGSWGCGWEMQYRWCSFCAPVLMNMHKVRCMHIKGRKTLM